MVLTREEFTKKVIEKATLILEEQDWFNKDPEADVSALGIDMLYDDGATVEQAVVDVVDETIFLFSPDEYEYVE